MKNTVKKILLPVSKAMALTFTLAFTVLNVGTAIANDNASVITSYLGGGGTNVVYIDNGEVSTDNDYYKSKHSSVKEVRGAGIDFTQRTMEEGAVLLKNDNNALPLSSTDKVSFFSASSAKSVVSGYRESGKGKDAVTFKDAFKDAGIGVNEELYNWYASSAYGRQSVMGHSSFANVYNINEAPWSALPESKTAAGYNTAVFVVSRIAGEASDVQMRDLGEKSKGFDGKNGNYLVLSENEEDVLNHLKEEKGKAFDKIIVILNTTNQVACDFEEKYGVDALLYTGSTGSAGTRGIANLLKGTVNPSGKLSDTFWKSHALNPVLANWGAATFNSGNQGAPYSAYSFANNSSYGSVVYQEGIYSGYRYTETRYEDKILGTAGVGEYNYNDVVAYPFGYGLSYTNFNYSDMAINYNAETDNFEISVKVTNAGGVAGKESVQLFLQKPYTDYDKQKGIEKAAVELVDFAKTGTLESGADETVNFTVARRELASYDSYGEKTYIVENGDYRFVVGHDAHDAVNNVLADKEKTGMTDVKGVTAAGDKNLVKKITVADGDNLYKAYAKSENGTDITNQFDGVDLKLYEHASDTDKNLKYVTRNDWAGTVKFGFTPEGTYTSDNYYRVTMTAEMLAEMPPNGDAQAVAGDLPTMGSTETAWQLIDMIQDEEGNLAEIPYDDQKWEQLLNQLTYAEMAEFLSDAYGFTFEINSISKPKTTDQDSDLGVINAYSYGASGLANKLADPDKDLYPAAYVDNGVVAATRNPELLYEYGLQWGEDCLWAGYSGLYGTGGNIHRSPYNGRNYGYYSEDPVLMGKCVSQINVGMEEKGAFMMMKHCMLNEQEAGRIGMSSWANEQTIREVYLKPFQIAIEEGGVQGVMTSLNRLGTVSAPHHPFMNTVLRGEFGMIGYNVTDSWMPYSASDGTGHMELISCLLNGNDLPLGGASVLKNNEAKYNTREYANVVWAMRDATHNVLYSVVHSNAMNGMSKNTRIITFQPEWQYYLDRINPAIAALFGISLAFFAGMEIWSYFGNGKKKKQ